MQDRIYSVDYLRMLMAGFVVVGHSGLGQQTVSLAGLLIGNVVLRSAVPLFAVTAGFFLYQTMQQGRHGRWIARLLILYVVWFCIYWLAMQDWQLGVRRSLYLFVFGYEHLWFLSGLAFAAVMLAFFRARGESVLLRSALVFAAAGLVLEYASYGHLLPIPLEIYRSGPFFLYPYVVIGYVFRLCLQEPEWLGRAMPSRRMLAGMAIVGFVIGLAENIVTVALVGPYGLLEYPFGMLLMAPGIFGLVLSVRMPATALPLAQMASAIYVMHYLVLHVTGLTPGGNDFVRALMAYIIPMLVVMWMQSAPNRPRWIAQLY